MFLLSMRMSGIKNIEKEIELNFYKKTLGRNDNFEDYRVKAIYGENGCGKTAIVTAVDILKNIITGRNYLENPSKQDILNELINKNTSNFKIECEFLNDNNGKNVVCKYGLELEKDEFDSFIISKEYLFSRPAKLSSKYDLIFSVEKGEIIKCNLEKEYMEIIENKTKNLLDKRCFVQLSVSNIILHMSKNTVASSSFLQVFNTLIFGFSIKTFLSSADKHDLFFFSKSLNFKNLSKSIDIDLKKLSTLTSVNEKYVLKSRFSEYEKKIDNLCRFIKMFKESLVNIDIEKRENDEEYECSLIFNYGKYSVHREFESAGIKRLIDLFDSMYSEDGMQYIVFIDEMDANINDVYLCKLIEYFMYYGKGQLCFTTHNTSPMNILRKNKKSINFLSNDNRIIEWHTNGNFSPEKLYQGGMIEYLPFNIEAVDFVGVLGE